MKKVLFLFIFALPIFARPLPKGGFDEIEKEMYGNGTHTKEDFDLAERRIRAFERDTQDLEKIAERADKALGAIFKVAYLNLRNYEFYDEAYEIKEGWKAHNGELQRIVALQRYRDYDIGDFKGILAFLDSAYAKIEKALGYQLTHALRLDDLLTLNKLNVVFNPCVYGEYEFTAHFCGDIHVNPGSLHPHRGELPVISYWCTNLACGIMTFGAGTIGFICGPISMLVEWSIDKYVAPKLEPKIYHKVCG